MQTLLQTWVIDGGITMVALIPCLILTLAFIVQGALALRRQRLAPPDYADAIRAARQSGGPSGAREALTAEEHSLAVIVRATDAQLQSGTSANMDATIRENVEIECDLLLQQNSLLPLLVRIAPYFGFLGALLGLHHGIQQLGNGAQIGVALAAGLNQCIVTSVWGLLIAIVGAIAYHLIQRRIAHYESVIFPTEAATCLAALRGDA